jgi:myo-inositol 2-dehydrogenase/D-chiro-inositol 1-dehydrogenase
MSFAICTVGCGGLARSMHGPSLALYRQRHPDVTLAACCDLDVEKARAFRDSFGFASWYTDLRAMIDAEKPDALTLIVPPGDTARLAVEVLDRGCPLLTEKPPGLNRSETLSMVAAARRSGAATMVAFNRRYMPISVRLKEVMAEPSFPAPEHVHYDFYRVGRTDEDFATTAVHAIDTVRFIAGSDYDSVRLRYRARERPAVGDVFLDCRFASGCTAWITFCPVSGIEMERVVVTARDVTLIAELPGWDAAGPAGSLLRFVGNKRRDEAPRSLSLSGELPCERLGFYGENATFFDALRQGARPSGPVEEALQVVEISDCLRRGKELYRRDRE